MNRYSLITIVLFSLLINLFINIATAEVFKWTDKNGQVHYSDKKPENQQVEEIKIKPHKPITNEIPSASETIQDSKKIAKSYTKKQKITMYGASWCGYCKKASAYFRKNKIKYTEYDIDKNANARKRYEKLGGTGLPLLVAKKKTMQGFNVTKFESWYKAL